MEGLRVVAEGLGAVARHGSIGFGFDELVQPVLGFISDCYWLFKTDTVFRGACPDADNSAPCVSDVILQRGPRYALAEPRFIRDFATLLVPDWTDVFGL